MVKLSIVALIALLASEQASTHSDCSGSSGKSLIACRRALRAVYKAAFVKERANWIADTSTDPFYQSPSNISSYVPGQPIRLERATKEGLREYRKVPHGLSVYRFMYQSLDINNNPVPASAFILLPYSRPNRATPIRLLVWAHGTSGIGRQCAPSNQRDLYYDYEGPFAMALRGYAVIAPDYAGQGTDTTFNYLAGPSHASDVAYAVIAARQALPLGLVTYEWVAVGHSEGGLTVWATNEREFTQPTGGFLGAVSIAPALANLHILRYGVEHGGLNRSLFYSSYTLDTIARLNKSIDVTKYYSEEGLYRVALASTGCLDTAVAVFANLTFGDIFKDPTWLYSSWATAWENRTAVRGDKPLAQPLLLIEGLADKGVYSAIPEAVFANHCAHHAPAQVHLSKYPNVGHDGVAYVSQLEYFEWIEDRFSGVQIATGCSNGTVDVVSTSRAPPPREREYSLVVQV